MESSCNIADALFARAAEAPQRVALHYPVGRQPDGRVAYAALSYGELARDVDDLARGLAAIGVAAGVRCALMVRPGREFFTLMFALFRAGAVPVLIDPGIDRRALRQCLAEAEPQAFIGIPLAQLARLVLGWARRSVRIVVTVGSRWSWGGHAYRDVLARGRARSASLPSVTPDQLAAILFTSGSTGLPKGVEYTHAMFAAQVAMIRHALGVVPGEVDLPTFAPFALFDPALGLTTVLPAMDFANPGRADPAMLADAVQRFGVTMLFGSPAVVEVLVRHGEAGHDAWRTIRRVSSAGAPVRPELVARLQKLLHADAEIWTPYGATESLPVALVEGRDIVRLGGAGTPQGAGVLVGRPLQGLDVRIIAISDAALPAWDAVRELPPGEVGEITVAGPSTTQRYFRRDRATALAKIRERLAGGPARIVHRMGDLGYFDAKGMLWYVGRKSHRVETAHGPMYTETVEGVFNAHPSVRRTALVGLGLPGAQRPVLCVELRAEVPASHWVKVRDELAASAARHVLTRAISDFRLHPGFPLDIRHNAKIGREKLALWAARTG